jgi:hypothetical protein
LLLRNVWLTVTVLGCSAAQVGWSAPSSLEPPAPSGKPMELAGSFPDRPCGDDWVEGSLRADVKIDEYVAGGTGMAIEVSPGSPEPSGVEWVPFVHTYWPSAYKGLQLANGEVAVVDETDHLIAMTGGRYQFKGGWVVYGSIGGPKYPYSWIHAFNVCGEAGSVIAE